MKRIPPVLLALSVGIVPAVSAALLLSSITSYDWKVIHDSESRYNRIIVQEDEKGIRYLLFSETGGYQSARKPGDTDHLELAYSRTMMVGLACVEEPKSILIVGLGAGSIPDFIHKRYPKTRIDCVDIDPDVIAVAKKFFGFKEDDNLKAHAADGRKFIEESRERYDMIFLDAYGNDYIPPPLTTKQFLEAVRKTLKPDGIVLGNVWSRYSNPLYDSMVRTYKAVFEQVYLVRVRERDNIIILAIPRKGKTTQEELSRRAAEVAKKRSLPFDLAELVKIGYRDAQEIEITDPVLEDPKKPAPGDSEGQKKTEAPKEEEAPVGTGVK